MNIGLNFKPAFEIFPYVTIIISPPPSPSTSPSRKKGVEKRENSPSPPLPPLSHQKNFFSPHKSFCSGETPPLIFPFPPIKESQSQPSGSISMIFHPALPLSAPEFWFFAYFFSLAEEEGGGEGRGETQMNRKTEKGGGGFEALFIPNPPGRIRIRISSRPCRPPGGRGLRISSMGVPSPIA